MLQSVKCKYGRLSGVLVFNLNFFFFLLPELNFFLPFSAKKKKKAEIVHLDYIGWKYNSLANVSKELQLPCSWSNIDGGDF